MKHEFASQDLFWLLEWASEPRHHVFLLEFDGFNAAIEGRRREGTADEVIAFILAEWRKSRGES